MTTETPYNRIIGWQSILNLALQGQFAQSAEKPPPSVCFQFPNFNLYCNSQYHAWSVLQQTWHSEQVLKTGTGHHYPWDAVCKRNSSSTHILAFGLGR